MKRTDAKWFVNKTATTNKEKIEKKAVPKTFYYSFSPTFYTRNMSDKTNEKVPSVVEENTEQNEVAQAQQSQELQEPKNVQELTNYIQSMLQQMQDRFQTMSDQVIIFPWNWRRIHGFSKDVFTL